MPHSATALANIKLKTIMNVRKVLTFNQTLGITFPKEYTNALSLSRGDHVEVFLSDRKTIIVRKLDMQPHKLKPSDAKISETL